MIGMDNFCDCENPNITEKEQGLTLVVKCANCGTTAATTNPYYFHRNPWLDDNTEYQVTLLASQTTKREYINLVRKFLAQPLSEVVAWQKSLTDVVIFKGKGLAFHDVILDLNQTKAAYEVNPPCAYLATITQKEQG